jgi:tetratricopeptide (TPR) repeat protein
MASGARGAHLLRRTAVLGLALLLVLGGAGVAAAKKKKKEEDRRQYTVSESFSKKFNAAREHLLEERYAPARELVVQLEKRADRLSPYERALVYQTLGFIESGQERYTKAIPYFEKCLAEEGMHPNAQLTTRFNVAQLYLATEQYAKAVSTLELWFKEAESPTSIAYYLLAIAYYQQEKFDRALPPAEKAVALATTPKESWLQLLVGLYTEDRQYAKAVHPLEQLVILYPKKTYWTQLSAIYAQQNQEEKSLAVLQLAYQQGFLELDRELRRLAQLYLYHGLPYRAARVLEKGLADEAIESDVEVWELLANSWLLAREYESALEPLTKAAELAEDGSIYVRLGQVHLEREEWSQASAALKKGLERGGLEDPGNANLLLGIAFYHLEKADRARRYFGAAQRSESTRESASQWLEVLDRESRKG